jgi:hypothetical protein
VFWPFGSARCVVREGSNLKITFVRGNEGEDIYRERGGEEINIHRLPLSRACFFLPVFFSPLLIKGVESWGCGSGGRIMGLQSVQCDTFRASFFFLPVLYWIPCTAPTPTPTTICPSPLQQFIHSVAYYPRFVLLVFFSYSSSFWYFSSGGRNCKCHLMKWREKKNRYMMIRNRATFTLHHTKQGDGHFRGCLI